MKGRKDINRDLIRRLNSTKRKITIDNNHELKKNKFVCRKKRSFGDRE